MYKSSNRTIKTVSNAGLKKKIKTIRTENTEKK